MDASKDINNNWSPQDTKLANVARLITHLHSKNYKLEKDLEDTTYRYEQRIVQLEELNGIHESKALLRRVEHEKTLLEADNSRREALLRFAISQQDHTNEKEALLRNIKDLERDNRCLSSILKKASEGLPKEGGLSLTATHIAEILEEAHGIEKGLRLESLKAKLEAQELAVTREEKLDMLSCAMRQPVSTQKENLAFQNEILAEAATQTQDRRISVSKGSSQDSSEPPPRMTGLELRNLLLEKVVRSLCDKVLQLNLSEERLTSELAMVRGHRDTLIQMQTRCQNMVLGSNHRHMVRDRLCYEMQSEVDRLDIENIRLGRLNQQLVTRDEQLTKENERLRDLLIKCGNADELPRLLLGGE